MSVRTSYAFVLFVTGSLCITAQHASFHANFKVFGFESGLGNLSVESVVQDHQGFLWVATEGGLFRYDGEKFESAGDGLGLPEYWPRGLHCSHDGWLWVGTPKGLYVKRGAHFKAVPIAGVAEIRGREAIDSDASGRVYVATPAGLMAGGPGDWRRIWPDAGAAPGEPGGQSVRRRRGVVWLRAGDLPLGRAVGAALRRRAGRAGRRMVCLRQGPSRPAVRAWTGDAGGVWGREAGCGATTGWEERPRAARCLSIPGDG